MIFSVVNRKGGAGKSMVSVNLASIASYQGHKTAIIDFDAQGSATDWHSLREANGKDDIDLILIQDSSRLSFATAQLKEAGYKVIVVDTPPSSDTISANATRVADLVVLPLRPGAFDLGGAVVSADVAKANNIPACVVLNQVRAQTVAYDSARRFVHGLELPLTGALGLRVDFDNAVLSGLGIMEYAPNSVAAREFRHFWNRTTKLLKKIKRKRGDDHG